jgi:hypothetical protein
MSKKGIVLTVIVLTLAALYVYTSDWFSKPSIQIYATIRPSGPSRIPRNDDTEVYPVTFAFDKKYQLTSVKVVSASEFTTNKYAHALWHLVTDSNSIPSKVIVYGLPPRGMKPSVPKARPQPLQPNITYLLLIEAGKLKGQKEFKTAEVVHVANQ